ncbi:MAG: hypothetical protein PHI06_06805, partial [Desulfobulbaceae bacterium]|nr:hypothetical protein [Desulfobulbaceae bacterium]
MLALLLLVDRGFRLPLILQKEFSVVGTVKKIGWYHLDLSPLVWGPVGQETVEIDNVSVEFSPVSLFQKRVAGVTVSGLTIHFLKGPGGYSLRGFTPSRATNSSATESEWLLPVSVGRLEVLQGKILVHEQGSVQVIPFQAHLRMDDKRPQRLKFSFNLPETFAGSVGGEIDLAGKMVQGDVGCQLPWPVKGGGLQGEFSAYLAADGTWHLITTAEAKGGGKGGALLAETLKGDVQTAPLLLECQGQGGASQEWAVTCSLATEKVVALDSGLELAGVTMRMPWRFSEGPLPPEEGKLAVTELKAHGKTLGGLALTLRQQGQSACDFVGDVHSVGLSEYSLLIKGDVGFDPVRQGAEFSIDLHLPSLNLDDVDLAEFVDLPEKVVVGGRLTGQARFKLRH